MRPLIRSRIVAAVFFAALLFVLPGKSAAQMQYTPKQLEHFRSYTGKTYWVMPEPNKAEFFSAPSREGTAFHPATKESFEIKEIVYDNTSLPFYKVAFASGKEGFIPVRDFLDQLNASFTALDPDRDAKAKAAKETLDEQKRREWIEARRWPEHVKQAALRKEPALGMNKREATAVLGKPKSVVPIKTGQLMGKQEQWHYENGLVITFMNGSISRIQSSNTPSK